MMICQTDRKNNSKNQPERNIKIVFYEIMKYERIKFTYSKHTM